MRILLAAKYAPHGKRPIGGVQTWCLTVYHELNQRGFQVVTWGPEQPLPKGRFDLGIVANVSDTFKCLPLCDDVVNVCHGIIPAEKPVGDTVVYTSEEVRDYWKIPGRVVRQPIDTDFWSPVDEPGTFLSRFSYRGGLPVVIEVAKDMGLPYKHIQSENAMAIRNLLRWSVCVLASGRASLEAMSCGVPVVICDHRAAYQGALLDPDTLGAVKRNYSGRGGLRPDRENLFKAVDSAVERGSLRDHVLEHHKVTNITDQLLECAP